ncbi:glycosyltransferase family 2 protein [Murimonas intestini]|uniref:glycosyltransferase family 2 protein n=1 Tax=Murimonas intestini TaxID=1337051 RepID=UPI0011DE1B47|nr:glycosyltransferase family 2 protein [Murimonas intestini]
MNEKILTVVVPSYNVEKYLNQCLDSFIVEDILADLEVLIVNDGSKDNTEKIGLQYQTEYPQTFKVITKENGGHGSAINTGISNASGKYFKVVDGDDWINTSELKDFIRFLKKSSVDIVASNYCWIDHGTQKPMQRQEHPFEGIEYKKDYLFDEISSRVFIKMHSMTIKTQILSEHNIKISEHRFYVDAEYIFFPIPYVRTVSFYESEMYMYRLGLPGQSMDVKKMQKNLQHHYDVLMRMILYYEELDKSGLSEAKLTYLQYSISRMLTSQFKIYISFPLGNGMRRKMMDLDKQVKAAYPQIYSAVTNKSIWILRKSGYLLFPAAVVSFRLLKAKIK